MISRFLTKVAPVAIAALVALPALAHADAIATLFNTGVGASGMPLSNNAAELHYSLAGVPSSTNGVRVATSANGYPIGPWIGDDRTSAWIGPNSGGALNGPAGDYDYRTTFDLSGFNPASASIYGQWSADDYGVDILLNGNSTGTTANDFHAFYEFIINSGFVDGVNTLDFIVRNYGYDLNPTGLRAELDGKADVPEPASMALLATGLLGLAFTGYKRT